MRLWPRYWNSQLLGGRDWRYRHKLYSCQSQGCISGLCFSPCTELCSHYMLWSFRSRTTPYPSGPGPQVVGLYADLCSSIPLTPHSGSLCGDWKMDGKTFQGQKSHARAMNSSHHVYSVQDSSRWFPYKNLPRRFLPSALCFLFQVFWSIQILDIRQEGQSQLTGIPSFACSTNT